MMTQNSPGKVSIAFDAWTSQSAIPFIGATAHYIDSEWTLRRQLIAFDFFCPPHDGESIGKEIFRIVNNTGISDNLQCLIGDSASSNIKGKICFAERLEEMKGVKWSHSENFVHCSAHSLNLVAQDLCSLFVTTATVNGQVQEVTYGDKDLENVTRRGRMAGAIAKISRMAALRNMGHHFGKDWKLAANDVKAPHRISRLKLLSAAPTRWSSRFYQIKRALVVRSIYNRMTLLPKYSSFTLSNGEWALLEWLKGLLEHIDTVLRTVSATESVSISHVIPGFTALFEKLESYSPSDKETEQDRQLRIEAVEKARSKLQKYYSYTSVNPWYVFGTCK